MQQYEYRVVPAPRRGEKAKGLKTTEDRFAHALTLAMNRMAADGWDYLRTDTLPVEERVGLTGRTTTFQHMLVFRRSIARAADAAAPAPRPVTAAPMPDFDDPDSPPVMTDLDPMDIAVRRAAMVARPQFGAAPRVSATQDTGLAPPVGPARGNGAAGQAAE